MTDVDAYEIQAGLIRRRLQEGEQLCGAKLGFTSQAMRDAMGVAEPNFGWLTDAMVSEDERLSAEQYIHPKAEPEIAFLLKRDLRGAATTAAHVIDATAAVMPSLEIVDSRYRRFEFQAVDNIADNSSASHLVIGGSITSPQGLDLSLLGVLLWKDGALVDTTAGVAVLGHPARAVAWLVRRLAVEGKGLSAGDIVISGGLTAPIDLSIGSVVTTEIAGLGDASVYLGN